MTDEDGHRIDAAMQFGFEQTEDDGPYICTEAQLIAFAKAAERKGRAEAIAEMERVGSYSTDPEKGALGVVIHKMKERNAASDAELAPILAAEEERYMTSRGYVRGTDEPGKRWVRHEGSEEASQISDCEVCGGDCAAANPPVMNCPFKDTDHV